MKNICNYQLFLLFLCLLFSSEVTDAQVSYPQLFKHQQQLNFQEKVYLHTDKDAYVAGETMWLRAHRADAMMHLPHLYSGLVYVEMYNMQDSLISRIKLAKLDSCFHSSLRLNSTLQEGDYYLMAYTNWMRNFDSTFFSKKKVHIYNSGHLKVNKTVTFRKGDDAYFADYKFLDENKKPFPGLLLKYYTKSGQKLVKQAIIKVDREGKTTVPIPFQDSITSIRYEFHEGKPILYDGLDLVPFFGNDYDVQFMPEGGHWLAGIQQKIAFKAVAENGKGEQISGEVVDDKGNVVMNFEATHKGMGEFSMKGEAGKKYTAKVKSPSGILKEFPLPEVVSQGITLQTMDFRGAIRCAVQATPGFVFPKGLTLIVHSRGRLLSALPVKAPVVTEVPAKILPKGIVHFALVDGANVYSERLAFAGLGVPSSLDAVADKPHYDRREKVTLNFTLPQGLSGDLSLSVTDSKKAFTDTLSDNISSYFLLSSDISGNIEEPAWYFDDRVDLVTRNHNLDLLMMTQAWRRFDLGMVCKGHTKPSEYFLELQQGIAGRILNTWGKPAINATVGIVGISARIFRFAQTDSTGRFEVNNMSFPEGTTLVIHGKKGKSNFVQVEMDKETYPGMPFPLASRQNIEELKDKKSDDFFSSLNLNYYYENGVKVYILDEVDIVAESESKDLIDKIYADVSDFRATKEDLESGGYATIFDWLSNVPGIYIENGDKITYRGQSPKIFVDDIPRSMEDFRTLSITDVESIGFVKSIEGMMALGEATTNADAGAVVVRLKNGIILGNSPKETANFFKINPLGYHRADTFYSPKYVTPQELKNPEVDERTTVYWNPRVLIGKDGKGSASFYTADIPTLYRVVAEGIAANGEIIRKEFMIDRR